MTLLDTVSRHLHDRSVAHALIGAAALAYHGVSRSTFDQDLLVTDRRVLDDSFWEALRGIATIDVRRGDAADPLAGVVRIQCVGERDVDLVVGRHRWQDDVLERAGPQSPTSGLRVVEAADLVLLKLYAGGTQDRWDIEQLLAADSSGALAREVRERLPLLPERCAALWAELRRP